jgi:iron(III) transport system substrate-binding protein
MSRISSRPLLALVLLLVLLVGAVAALAMAAGGGDGALVVYNGRSHYGGERAFERFEQETGIEVELFGGDATELFERLRNEGQDTPADLLVTVDGANLWQAADAGLLAPHGSTEADGNVPERFRDPDGRWIGISQRVRAIMINRDRVDPGALSTYEDLGDRRWRGRLCLRTSNNIYNQSLVSDLLVKRGPEETEALLRSWMDNQPRILGSDVDVLDALGTGQCDVGLTNHYYLARRLAEDPDFPVAPVWPDQDGAGAHANLSGAGVIAASDRKADAARLLAFLTQRQSQREIAENGEFPTSPDVGPADHIAEWTGFETDAIDVARAGARQRDAVQLMAEVGWE